VLLGPQSFALVMWAIPQALDAEWACVGPTGAGSRRGELYAGGAAVAGVLGWMLAFSGRSRRR
jgi:hypothetical protein